MIGNVFFQTKLEGMDAAITGSSIYLLLGIHRYKCHVFSTSDISSAVVLDKFHILLEGPSNV